jgi:hypothetical protein
MLNLMMMNIMKNLKVSKMIHIKEMMKNMKVQILNMNIVKILILELLIK